MYDCHLCYDPCEYTVNVKICAITTNVGHMLAKFRQCCTQTIVSNVYIYANLNPEKHNQILVYWLKSNRKRIAVKGIKISNMSLYCIVLCL